MSGFEELLITNGGTLLTFAIFIGERIIQATKDRKGQKQKIDDETVRAYLEWLRQQDQKVLLNKIEAKHDELVAVLTRNVSELNEFLQNILHHINSDFDDLKSQLEALNKSIQRPVLSSIPLNCRSNWADAPLLSRDSDLVTLRQTVGDIIISGQPGSGKTFLLYHLAKEWEAKFLVSRDEGDIVTFLRFASPPAIIVDDAYDWQDILQRLIHLRIESSINFRIIVTCWPYEELDLLHIMQLTTKNIHRLALLPADIIVQLIKNQFGGAGYGNVATWLIREIRKQSAGRPGLALRLVDLILEEGSLRSLTEGQAHFELIDRVFHRLESSGTREILAAFAVGGKTGLRKEDVSSVLDKPIFQTTQVLRMLATGGVIEETQKDTLATIPEVFRHVLLKDVFLRRDALALEDLFWNLYEKASNKESALIGLIGAIANDAVVNENRLISELQGFDSIKPWVRLAWINEKWCKKAIDAHLKEIESFADPALYHIPEKAIPLLLNAAIGDTRPENSHPEASVRKLGDWVTQYSIHKKDAVHKRRTLLNITISWLRHGGDVSVAWKILPKCVSFEYENIETDPGKGNTVTITSGAVSLSELQEIATLWISIIECVKEYPPTNWESLKRALNGWCYPYVPNVILPNGFTEFTIEKLKEVIQQLISCPDLPINALIRWAIEHDMTTEIPADAEFLIFCPPDLIHIQKDWRAAHKKYGEDATILGAKWATQTPESVAEKLVYFEKERQLFGINWPLMGHSICYSLADNLTDLAPWVEAFMKYEVAGDYFFPLIRKAIENKYPQINKWLSSALLTEIYRWHAITEILSRDELPQELFLQAWPLLGEYSRNIGIMALHGDIAESRLESLCEHDNKNLLLEITIGDFHSDKQVFLERNQSEWLKMFRKAIVGLTKLDPHYFYDIEKLLERFPEIRLFLAEELLSNAKYISWVNDKPYRRLFESMERDEKIQLLALLEDLYSTDFTAWFVNDDMTIYRALLENDKLRSHHLIPLKGKPSDPSWQKKALLALEYGYQPHEVARAARGNVWGWTGSAVSYWQKWIDEYSALLSATHPSIREVGRIGKEYSEYERDKANKEEAHEAIYGISDD